jgi:peptide/nickel transport system permease protein
VSVAAGQVLAVSVLVFGLTALLPGDTAEVVLGQQATPDQIVTLRAQLGADRPLGERFTDWAGGLLTGDLGHSLVTGVPVADEIGSRLAGTLTVAVLALVVLLPLGLAMGVAAGRRPGSATDRVLSGLATAGQAVPEFALGLVLVAVFAVTLGWLPATAGGGSFTGPAVLVLPVVVLAVNQVGRLARQVRIGVVETDGSEHVVHLRRLGLDERTVLLRHVLPGAVLPSIQQLARIVDGLLGGVVVVEALFALPGVGAGFVAAVEGRDLPLVQGYALLFAVTTVTVNLVADLAAARLTPYREALT